MRRVPRDTVSAPPRVFIYVLVDPRNDAVRYVGRTIDPKARLAEHVRERGTNRRKERWIEQLIGEGLTPLLIVVEECAPEVWRERERFWELAFRQRGHQLTNLRDCGDGPVPGASTPEFREKMRARLAEQRAHSDWASAKDYCGQRFGRLTAVERLPYRARTEADTRCYWRCRCNCGGEKAVQLYSLLSGATRSCGCLEREALANGIFRKHGRCYTREYKVWTGFRLTCENPSDKRYPFYGGRGITVCPEWRSFERFLADMGEAPTPAHVLGRIDKDGPYSPANCRWMTRRELMQNSRGTHWLTVNGVARSITEWAALIGLSPNALQGRLREGWEPAEAVTTPPLRHWRDRRKPDAQ